MSSDTIYLHTSLYTGLSVKGQPGFRTGNFFKKMSHVMHLYRQQGGLISPEVCSSAAIYFNEICLYEITLRL